MDAASSSMLGVGIVLRQCSMEYGPLFSTSRAHHQRT
ncbi:hypothetical protein [Sporisorium scitamineum]|uniref:Uncharacterized protein n=1 Tax=Sporisorium scitamineum TaxID=49012 RepID=A0A0F7S365_9BASI|nr:hypothetical protein [Sporisorium scitamineum]